MIEIDYAHSHNFPYPRVGLKISSMDTGRFVSELPAKLDTGADRTLLTQSVVDSLGLPVSGEAMFEVAGGAIATLPLYFVSLSVEGLEPVELHCAASDREDLILLGRDIPRNSAPARSFSPCPNQAGE